jgi:hypothetical protein
MTVEMAIEEGLDVPVGLNELFGKMRHRPSRMTHIVSRLRLDILNVSLGTPITSSTIRVICRRITS